MHILVYNSPVITLRNVFLLGTTNSICYIFIYNDLINIGHPHMS